MRILAFRDEPDWDVSPHPKPGRALTHRVRPTKCCLPSRNTAGRMHHRIPQSAGTGKQFVGSVWCDAYLIRSSASVCGLRNAFSSLILTHRTTNVHRMTRPSQEMLQFFSHCPPRQQRQSTNCFRRSRWYVNDPFAADLFTLTLRRVVQSCMTFSKCQNKLHCASTLWNYRNLLQENVKKWKISWTTVSIIKQSSFEAETNVSSTILNVCEVR